MSSWVQNQHVQRQDMHRAAQGADFPARALAILFKRAPPRKNPKGYNAAGAGTECQPAASQIGAESPIAQHARTGRRQVASWTALHDVAGRRGETLVGNSTSGGGDF